MSGSDSASKFQRSLRQFLLRQAFAILGGFTLLFLITVLPIVSQGPYSQAALLPARIALGLGVATWVVTLLVCIKAFFNPAERPSLIASLSFFLIFGIELRMVAVAANVL